MDTGTVSVPRERLDEFYSLLSQFFRSKVQKAAAPESGNRALGTAGEAAPLHVAVTGRYAPPQRFFEASEGTLDTVFEQIDDTLGSHLPSARKHRPCWANSQVSLLGRIWLQAGWRLAALDMQNQEVRFERHDDSICSGWS